MYKVLLIDRCYFSRLGMVSWLHQFSGVTTPFEILTCDHLLRAREAILQWQPNMVIADLYGFMGEVHHVSQFSSIFAACGNTTRLVLLQSGSASVLDNYCEQQRSWLTVQKSIALEELRDVLRQAMLSRPPFGKPKTVAPLLTLREERILKWWTDGLTNDAIARNMNITVKTVYTYKRNIRMKLGADNRLALFVPLPEMSQV